MKLILGLICAVGLWAATTQAQSPVTLTIDTRTNGAAIPDNFIGLSFGMKALLPSKTGAHIFSPTNTSLVTLFQNLGLKHLRMGGTTVEAPPTTPIPGQPEIDDLFAFAKAAGVNKIIYSFRLLETNSACNYAETNAALAKYIWAHYRPYLESFAIGNEPDLNRVFKQDYAITNFGSYLDKWRRFADAITNAVPEATLAGPDGSGNVLWTTRFARAEKNSGIVSLITLHYYAGGKGRDVEARHGIDTMLSPAWLKSYQTHYDKSAAPVLADGLPYRFTEANDHYTGGVPDASDTFAGALWALDFLHWWAAHSTRGVDFHNTQWVVSDIVTPDENGGFKINPKGYGLKAFDLGSHGNIAPLAITNPAGLNLTAYAVRDHSNLFVTVINKEHGDGARAAELTIMAGGITKNSEVLFLTAPNNDVTAKTGVTLGGASINADGPWLGKWTPLQSSKKGQCVLKVAASTAALVRVSTE